MEVEGVGWRWYWGGRRARDGVGRGRREGGRVWEGEGGREGGKWRGERSVRVLLYS